MQTGTGVFGEWLRQVGGKDRYDGGEQLFSRLCIFPETAVRARNNAGGAVWSEYPTLVKAESLRSWLFCNRRFASDRQGNVFLGRWGYSNFGTNIVAIDVLDVLGGKADRAPSLYYVQSLPEGQGKKKKDLMDHRNLFSGKIVILQVQDLGGIYPSAYQWIVREYAQILDNITKGYILTRSWAYTLAAIVIGVAVTGVILARGKPLPATGFLTLLWGIEIYVPGWLFQCHGILVDAPPIFASLIASFVVFVIVRLGHEWKTSLLPSPSYHKTRNVIDNEPTAIRPIILKGGRLSLAWPAALAIGLLIVMATLFTRLAMESSDNQPDTVYVMSLPVIEVQSRN